jgi:hypothetical protein
LKRRQLIKKIEAHGGVLIRHGGKHDWYQNPATKFANQCRGITKSMSIWHEVFCGSYPTRDVLWRRRQFSGDIVPGSVQHVHCASRDNEAGKRHRDLRCIWHLISDI